MDDLEEVRAHLREIELTQDGESVRCGVCGGRPAARDTDTVTEGEIEIEHDTNCELAQALDALQSAIDHWVEVAA